MGTLPDELKGKYVFLTAQAIEEKDGRFTAICEELGLATCDHTSEAALTRLRNSVIAVLNKATERNEILGLLEDCGVQLRSVETKKVPTPAPVKVASMWLPTKDTISFGSTPHNG